MPLAANLSPSSITSAVAKGLVKGVTIRSQVTPDVYYDPWAPPSQEPESPLVKAVMEFVKPSIMIDTATGPIVYEPAGPPTENNIPIVVLGGIALIVGAVTLIGAVARATR
jgi:hypothetical protein